MAEWVLATDIQSRLQVRPRFGHKGTFGHACIVAGSKGMPGAAILATRGCLRSGVGLVTSHVPASLSHALAVTVPDAMCSIDAGSDHLVGGLDPERFTAIGVGPGLGMSGETLTMLKELLDRAPVPIVLDADALNLMAGHRELLAAGNGRLVLTPHPKEMDRLLGSAPRTSYERLLRARDLAVEHQCTVVLKGAYTATCTRDGRIFMNPTGNVGMAKGGSGDVLTGLLTGLMAQGYEPEDACLIGVFLHGSAGDITAQDLGQDAMRPSDLVGALSTAWKRLRGVSEQALQ
jgi:NAD(P)H-hydrate epimerase